MGAVEGAVGAAALEPLNYALDRASQNDWTMGNAAMNIALGGAMGGVLHPAIGAFGREERLLRARDRVQGIIDGLAPETRETAMRGALAQIVEGRRVNVADAIDAAEAMRAAGELRTWAEQTRRLTEETDAAIGSTTPRETADWGPVAAKARENLARLAEEANGIRAEIASVQVRTLRAALDPDTLARLNDIEGELAGTIPRARRQRLEQERQGILEGVNRERTVAGAADNIEVARGLAEEQGLRAALARAEAQRQAAEAAAGSTDEMVALAARQREADAATTDRGWSRREALIASKAEVIQALTERTLRRYAAQLGVEAGDAGRSALRILTAEDPGAEALAVLSEMRRGAPRRMGVPTPDDMKAQEAMDAALSRLYGEADRARMAAMDAERVTDSRISDTAARVEELNANAPKAEGVVEKQIAEVTKDLAALDTVIQAERNAGRFSPEQERILREFDDAAKMAEGDAKAMEAAGFCAAVRG